MKTHAFVTQAHTVSNPSGDDLDHSVGAVIQLPATQFNDFEGAGLVRKATAEEIADAKKADEAK